MGKDEANATPIISIQCSVCHNSTIYLKVKDHENNHAPFKNNQFTCTECTQRMVLNQPQPASSNDKLSIA